MRRCLQVGRHRQRARYLTRTRCMPQLQRGCQRSSKTSVCACDSKIVSSDPPPTKWANRVSERPGSQGASAPESRGRCPQSTVIRPATRQRRQTPHSATPGCAPLPSQLAARWRLTEREVQHTVAGSRRRSLSQWLPARPSGTRRSVVPGSSARTIRVNRTREVTSSFAKTCFTCESTVWPERPSCSPT